MLQLFTLARVRTCLAQQQAHSKQRRTTRDSSDRRPKADVEPMNVQRIYALERIRLKSSGTRSGESSCGIRFLGIDRAACRKFAGALRRCALWRFSATI